MHGTQVHGLKTARSYVIGVCRRPGLHQTNRLLSNTSGLLLLLLLLIRSGDRKLVVAKVKDYGRTRAIIILYMYLQL